MADELNADELTVNWVAVKVEAKVRPTECVFDDTIFAKVSGATTVCPRVEELKTTVEVPCVNVPDVWVRLPFIVMTDPLAVRFPPLITVLLVIVMG